PTPEQVLEDLILHLAINLGLEQEEAQRLNKDTSLQSLGIDKADLAEFVHFLHIYGNIPEKEINQRYFEVENDANYTLGNIAEEVYAWLIKC
ncbi:MAG: hypothetical protein AABX29_08350, partial [Nanoarchaeota archaeon]